MIEAPGHPPISRDEIELWPGAMPISVWCLRAVAWGKPAVTDLTIERAQLISVSRTDQAN